MLTGEQYLSSLDDGRMTYYEGHQVKDLLSEPAFAVPARAIANGYDRCYSSAPASSARWTSPSTSRTSRS